MVPAPSATTVAVVVVGVLSVTLVGYILLRRRKKSATAQGDVSTSSPKASESCPGTGAKGTNYHGVDGSNEPTIDASDQVQTAAATAQGDVSTSSPKAKTTSRSPSPIPSTQASDSPQGTGAIGTNHGVDGSNDPSVDASDLVKTAAATERRDVSTSSPNAKSTSRSPSPIPSTQASDSPQLTGAIGNIGSVTGSNTFIVGSSGVTCKTSHYHLPPERESISDLDLHKISERLGSEWQKLATHLGLSAAEIDRIEMHDPGQTENQIFNMLAEWRRQQSTSTDQREVLCTALMEIGKTNIADDLIHVGRNLDDEPPQVPETTGLKGPGTFEDLKQETIDNYKETATTIPAHPILQSRNQRLETLKSQSPSQIDPKLSYLSFTPGQRIGDINLGKLEVEAVKWEMCREFGKVGSGPGQFRFARGITATQPGEIAVADWINNRVVICSNEGQHKGTIPVQCPVAVAAIHNPEQRLFVLEKGSKYVKVFNMKDNTLVKQFPTVPKHQVDKTKMNLMSLAVTKNSILVGDIDNMVWTEHKPTDGEILRTIPVQTPPWYLAVDDDTDKVVVSGGHTKKVDIVDRKGTGATNPTINDKPVGECRGVCCDSSGIYLAVQQGRTGTIHHYALDGRFLDCLPQFLHNPCGITFTSDGQLAVTMTTQLRCFTRCDVIQHDID